MVNSDARHFYYRIQDLKLSASDENTIYERMKDLEVSSPSTMHPIDSYLKKLGFVTIKGGLTTYIGKE